MIEAMDVHAVKLSVIEQLIANVTSRFHNQLRPSGVSCACIVYVKHEDENIPKRTRVPLEG